jgi:hypothetical protein
MIFNAKGFFSKIWFRRHGSLSASVVLKGNDVIYGKAIDGVARLGFNVGKLHEHMRSVFGG